MGIKAYLLIVGALCAVALTVTVALRIPPDAWATLMGILFGGLASLPMMVVAVILLLGRPGHDARPTVPPPQYPSNYVAPPRYPATQTRYQQPGDHQLPGNGGQSVDYNDHEQHGYIESDYYYVQPPRGRR